MTLLLFRRFLLAACLAVLVCKNAVANLDKETIDVSVTAMKLCVAAQNEELGDFVGAEWFEDDSVSDAAILYETESFCFVVFDSTTRFSARDWWKSFDLTVDKVCPVMANNDGEGACCQVRNGHEESYTNPSYKNELDQKVIECHNNGEKEVIITGHSLGGSIATAAAIGLASVDPTLITFGQLPTLVDDCPSINPNKYYHFANTIVNHWGRNLDYDPVSSLRFGGANNQIGQLILMSPQDSNNVLLYENGKAPNIWDWGMDYEAHSSLGYLKVLQSYQGKQSISTNGWAPGVRCNIDDECDSKQCQGWATYWISGTCA